MNEQISMKLRLLKFSGIYLFLILFTVLFLGSREAFPETSLEDIRPFPGSKILCTEHISGNTGHILWRSYSSEAAASEVVKYFENQLQAKASESEGTYSLTSRGNPELKISIAPKSNSKGMPSCKKEPPQTAKVIIVISQLVKPN